jgi:pyruvate,water dikinase
MNMPSTSYILDFSSPNAGLATAGGKGASLVRLHAAGLPVPAGFIVTTDAYRQFVAAHNLQSGILAALADIDLSQPVTLEDASRRVRSLFAQGEVPPEIASAVAQAYATLPGTKPAVAVRSSATAEDLPEASFAGQQDTYLNVTGASAVLEATRNCWASLWTARAIGYRARQGIPPECVALAVVVQVLVPAEAAGIMFTADPVSGRRDRMLISAAWGLGEAVVGGLVTPDSLTLDKASLRLVERQTADKQTMTVRHDGGTAEQAVPEGLRRAPVLSDEQAAELGGLGAQIERLYDLPMDIEWALSEARFAIVQARPITALPEPQGPVPTSWPRPNPKAMYARSSLAEHLPNPVSPLFRTLGLRLANEATGALMRSIVARGESLDTSYETVNGYVYMGIVLGAKDVWVMTKMTVSQFGPILKGSAERWHAASASLERMVAKWTDVPLQGLGATELLEGAREIAGAIMRYYTVIQAATLPAATTSEVVFTRFYNHLIKRRDDPVATTFLFGFETAALRAEKSLFDLAAWVKDRPEVAKHIVEASAGALAAELKGGRRPEGVPLADWDEWLFRFNAHLAAHGRTAYEFDFANATPAEQPAALLATVKTYLMGQGINPTERQRAAVERREQATQSVLNRLGWPRKGWFVKLLKWAQAAGPAREDSLADLGMGHSQLRRVLGELGSRLVAAGVIGASGDVYWLTENELATGAARLDQAQALESLSPLVAARKAEWRGQLKALPPAMLPEKSRWSKVLPWSEQRQAGRLVLKGVGTGAGKITAPACVLFGPEGFGSMKPGDVLVAVTTTPAWTPLFAMASAVVTDIGGPLSHSSIVAREYGIPAVMATGVATRRIHSGDLITVDGSAGTVTLIADS